jgi:hypothetical protein
MLRLSFNDPEEFLKEAAQAPPGTVFRLTCRRQYGQPFVRVSVVCSALIGTARYHVEGRQTVIVNTEPTVLRLEAPCGEGFPGENPSKAGQTAKAMLDTLTDALTKAGFQVREGLLEAAP